MGCCCCPSHRFIFILSVFEKSANKAPESRDILTKVGWKWLTRPCEYYWIALSEFGHFMRTHTVALEQNFRWTKIGFDHTVMNYHPLLLVILKGVFFVLLSVNMLHPTVTTATFEAIGKYFSHFSDERPFCLSCGVSNIYTPQVRLFENPKLLRKSTILMSDFMAAGPAGWC